jgi:molybdopterin molybdotransferase
MIPIEEANKILSEIKIKMDSEIEGVSLLDSLDRILARDIVSEINMPPFDKSAMDGFALSTKDPSEKYRIIETIAAGDIPQKQINPGECTKIMTGAMLPIGADRVIKKEVVDEQEGYMKILEQEKVLNVCYKGEDVEVGNIVLRRGSRIRPQETGILASMGINQVQVYRKPVVGIITTGSEIIEPGGNLQEGQIFNSNAYSISAQVKRLGANVRYGGIVRDDKTIIKNQIEKLLEEVDMIIISGGVSMGDYDYVPGILDELGVKLYFQKVAVKPGKPTVFGTKGNKVFFGLPGNPVSTFVIFEIFVKPILYKLMGFHYEPFLLKAKMKTNFKRKRSERTAFIPVKYANGGVEPIEYHGSAHIYALAGANGLLEVPSGTKEFKKGTDVHVRQI